MGLVHGVYLKYVAVSAGAGLAANTVVGWETDSTVEDVCRMGLLFLLAQTCVVNGAVAVAFKLRVGMRALGKDPERGTIPLWSYVVFFGFHGPTWLYTSWSRRLDRIHEVPVASEVEPGWWIGGRYAAELGREFAGTVDLTCEFPEGCITMTEQYLLLPCWDGVPPSPDLLDHAANFAVSARAHGHVMVHCAHGRGRSTTVLCACLVKAGMYATWEDAFEAIKSKRRVVKLNSGMKAVLETWQSQYMASSPTAASKLDASFGEQTKSASTPFGLVRDLFQRMFAQQLQTKMK
eukprot:gb/GFBE01048971.1/.p1 GENE.gb/GFBE01048971.1/~~gb/GFBE01048971.1/.p1  ORF type:complete len:292 (+),score=32.22 gb/GFBE01048971.1/:1-876(+)